MEVEIFVVDNHSQDDSLDYLIPRFPEVRFIANTENVGFARANNQAIEQSTGKYVLLLNPDTVIAENTLYEVFQFMEAHPEAGGTGVKMLDGDGRFLPESKRGFPTPWVSFCKIFGLSALFPHSRIFGRYHMKYLSPDECHPIDILSGAFMFMRRETLDKSGLLDESFSCTAKTSISPIGSSLQDTPIISCRLLLYITKERARRKEACDTSVSFMKPCSFFQKHYPHYSKGYYLAVKFSIFFRASLAAAYRVVSFPFHKHGKPIRKRK